MHTVSDSFELREPSNAAVETSLDDNVETILPTETSDKTIEKNQAEGSNKSIYRVMAATMSENSKKICLLLEKERTSTTIIFFLLPDNFDTLLPADYF